MLHPTGDDLRRTFSDSALRAGRAYAAQGRVGELRVSPDGHDGCTITARVRGSEAKPYRVRVHLRPQPGGRTAVSADCTCFVGLDCKHAVAAIAAAEGLPAPAAAATATELDPAVQAWLDALARAGADGTEEYPPGVRKRLLYVARCAPPNPWGGPAGLDRLDIDVVGVEFRKDGALSGTVRRYSPHQLSYGEPPRFLRPSDQAILRALGQAGTGTRDGEVFAVLLRRIADTGRGRWGKVDGPPLRIGEGRPGRLAWQLGQDGTQRLVLEAGDGLLALDAGDPWYAEPETGTVGPLGLDHTPAVLRAALAAPPLLPANAARVGAELARRLPSLALPQPQAVATPKPLGGTPLPCLELLGMVPAPPAAWGTLRPDAHSDGPVPLAQLWFEYDGVPVQAFGRASRLTVLHDGRLYDVTRNPRAEASAEETLREVGLERLDAFGVRAPAAQAPGLLALDDEPAAWITLLLEDVPELRRAGWRVDVAGSFPVRLAQAEGDFTAEITPSGEDWFQFHLGALVDGERVDLVPALLDLIGTGEAAGVLAEGGTEDGAEGDGSDPPPLLLPLPDGRLLLLDAARIRPVLATLLELYAGGLGTDGGLRLGRRDAAALAGLEDAAGLVWQGGEALRALGRALRGGTGVPHVPPPAWFRAALRPYQQRGVDWLQFLRAAGSEGSSLGGVLADEMGLGKTVQALAHLAIEKGAGRLDRPALLVCPTSLVPNWRAEAERFAPALRVLPLHGPTRKERFGEIAGSDLVVTTYPLLSRDEAALTAHEWSVAVLDEAHGIKNPAAATSTLARRLRARQRIALTGTPLENNLGELWSLFDWLLPGFLGSKPAFGRAWRTPIERHGDPVRRALLADRVRPFLLRRTKAEVAAELPPRTEVPEPVELGAGQRAVYEGIRLAMHAKVRAAIEARGLARSGIVVLDALLKLRQACCDPRLLKLSAAQGAARRGKAGSAKLDRLMEMLPPMLEAGRRVLVFSQFTSMLALIEQALEGEKLPYLLLTGSTKDRATPVRRFQSGEAPLFLVSLKAGGVGLNLTAADTVVHYDPWWNPAAEDQATDRAHRIGQDKPVFVHRLIAQGTVEERMEALKDRKRALAAGILGGAKEGALALTEADVEALLAPG